MLMNLAGSAQTLIIAGVGAFSFKFLTEQYNLDFDTSGYLIGKCTVFTVTIPRDFTNQISICACLVVVQRKCSPGSHSFAGGLILVGSFGMFLGGLLVKVFRLEMVGMTRLCAAVAFLSGLLGIAFLAGCPETPLAGLQVTYSGSS